MRILLIGNDMLVGDGIRTGLSKMDFSVDWFIQGHQRRGALYSVPYDAVILDSTLSGMDGRDILRERREKGQREPALILTTHDMLVERVEGLHLGTDDYLCKFFALIEVVARLEALMCRTNGQASNELHHGNVMLGPGKCIATLVGEPSTLKPKEFALLELLVCNTGRTLSRKLIEEKLYTWDEEVTSDVVEVYVHHL